MDEVLERWVDTDNDGEWRCLVRAPHKVTFRRRYRHGGVLCRRRGCLDH
jgi:hypothetical protein